MLHQDGILFHHIHDLLQQQFDRLSPLAQKVMYWLAIAREPVFLEELQADLLSSTARQALMTVLESLQGCSLMELVMLEPARPSFT